MTRYLLLVFLVSFNVQLAAQTIQIDFLQPEFFQFEVACSFREKPTPSENYEEAYPAFKGVLPFVALKISFQNIKINAHRIVLKSSNGQVLKRKKYKQDEAIFFDLGYSYDIIDQIIPNHYYIFLVDKQKTPLYKLSFKIDESGSYFLNNSLLGKL